MIPVIDILLYSLLLSVTPAVGENQSDNLTATVEFLVPDGSTTTNGDGIFYTFGGGTTFEPKIYPETYWGTFPLYYPGTTMNFTVTLNNTMSQGKKPYKVKVEAISNVLQIDGTLGQEIDATQTWVVTDLLPGQSQTLTGSVDIPGNGLPPGLDVTRILISHLNEGDNDDDTPDGLIDVEYCLWCPPPAPVAAH